MSSLNSVKRNLRVLEKNLPPHYTEGVESSRFKENLARLMAARNLTTSELARQSGVSYQQITYYLSGDPRGKLPTVKNLVKLAKALRCDLEALTGYEELRGITSAPEVTEEESALLEFFKSLPEGDTLKEMIKQKIEQMKRENEKEGDGS